MIREHKIRQLSRMNQDPVFDAVLGHCSLRYGVTQDQVLSTCRDKKMVAARHLVVYLMREYCNKGTEEIAWRLKRKDHSTIVTAYYKIKAQLRFYSDLREEVSLGEQIIQKQK